MSALKPFFKKNHWLIIPALLATFFVGSGVLLVQVENDFGSNVIAMPFVVLGVFYALLEDAGMGAMGSIFLLWMLTFCSFLAIYYMARLLYRIFVPVKAGKG